MSFLGCLVLSYMGGLTDVSWQITSNLVRSKLHVDEQYIHVLPMNEECVVDGVKVTLLDANQ